MPNQIAIRQMQENDNSRIKPMTNAPGLTQWIPLPYGAFGAVLRDPLGFQLYCPARSCAWN